MKEIRQLMPGILSNKLQNKSFHFLLIPVIFIFHICNDYWNLIPTHLYIKYLFIYLLLAVFLFFLMKMVFKKNMQAAIFVSLLLILFFGFGAFHDLLKTYLLPSFFVSYTFLLPLITFFYMLLGWQMKNIISGFEKLNYFLNTLFILLLALECLFFIYNLADQKQRTNNLNDRNNNFLANNIPCDSCTKPDIYFIVWDGYTSSACLKENFNFDNSGIDTFLTNRHFFISKKSKSNYRITPFSIASTLNMNYLDDKGMTGMEASPKLMLQAINTVKKNEWVPFLKNEGYDIKNYSVFDFESDPTESTAFFKYYTKQFLFNETLYGRIKRDIWWNFIKFFPHKPNEVQATLYHNYVEQNIEKLLKVIRVKKEKPLFVYTHIMIPHEPFYLDEKGNFVPDSLVHSSKNMKQSYVQQLIYTNSLLKKITNALLSDSTRPKIIIMEGDHGFRNYSVNEEKQKPFENLNCYYFTDGDYSSLYDGISPVNSFRVILNKYFKKNLPVLPDSSINIWEISGN